MYPLTLFKRNPETTALNITAFIGKNVSFLYQKLLNISKDDDVNKADGSATTIFSATKECLSSIIKIIGESDMLSFVGSN